MGHIGLEPGGIDVITPPGATTPLDFESTFALFRSDDGASWQFTCHEALLADPANPSNQLPRYARTSDALLVSMRSVGLGFSPDVDVYRSTDGGCDWGPVQGLTGHTIADVEVLADGQTVIAGSADNGALNGLFVSTDGGANFGDSDNVAIDGLVLSIAAGPGQVVWATSLSVSGGTVWRSEDAGQTWSSSSFTFDEEEGGPQDFVLPMAHPTDDQMAWVTASGNQFDYVYRTSDGGQNWTEVFRGTLSVNDGVVCGSDVLLAQDDGRPALSSDGGASFEVDGDMPVTQGAACVDGEMVLALSRFEDAGAVATVPGDAEFLMGYGDVVEEMSCPDGTRHAQVCSELWPTACAVLDLYRPENRLCSEGDDDDAASPNDDDDDDDDDSTPPAGPGCNNAVAPDLARGPGLWWASFLLLGVVAWRRWT